MTNNQHGSRDGPARDYSLGMAVALGGGLGMLFGLLLGNIAVGITGGVVASLLVGLAVLAQAATRDDRL